MESVKPQEKKDSEPAKSRSRSRSRSKRRKRKESPGSSRSSRSKRRKKVVEIFVPDTNGPLVSLHEFIELQKVEISPELANKIHSKYKRKHMQRQTELFFYEHKVSEGVMFRTISGSWRSITRC